MKTVEHLGKLSVSEQVPSGPKGYRRIRNKQQLCVQIKALTCICTDPQLEMNLGKYERNLVLGQLVFQ